MLYPVCYIFSQGCYCGATFSASMCLMYWSYPVEGGLQSLSYEASSAAFLKEL